MCHRRLTVAVLLWGGCLLVWSGTMYGQNGEPSSSAPQREVIATAAAVTPEKNPAPPALLPAIPKSPVPLSAPVKAATVGEIQQASFVPEPPNHAPAAPTPTTQATTPSEMVPPSALFSGITNRSATLNPVAPSAALNPVAAVGSPAALLSVEVVGPDRLMLGQPLVHEIVLRNRGLRPIAELHVEEPLPEGVRALSTEPPAAARDNRLIWDVRQLEAGGERRLKAELNPGRTEVLDLRPSVTFVNGSGLRTRVMRPPFSVELSANHTRATRGERIRFSIQLANNSLEPIRNIKLYDSLPTGLHHPRASANRKIGIEHFGDLQPGQRCTIALETTAVESGPFRNEVLAQADRGIEASAALDVVISEPNLTLNLKGPERTDTQREVDFSLEVVNPGVLAVKGLRVIQALPPEFEVVTASSGASLDINQHALVWSLPDLEAGHRQSLLFRIKVNTAGDWPMAAAVLSQNFPEAKAHHTLHAEAAAALNLEVRGRDESLSLGEETVFRIRVFNNGDAACAGLRLTATLPDAVTPSRAEGPSREQIEKQQVHFAPLARLDAHGDVVYCIHVRGQKAGKGSVHVEVAADKQTPSVRDASIQVNDAKAPSSNLKTVKHENSLSGETLR